jgi:hypothetical protein
MRFIRHLRRCGACLALISGCATPKINLPEPEYAKEYNGAVKACLEHVRAVGFQTPKFLEARCGVAAMVIIPPPYAVWPLAARRMTFQIRWFDQPLTPRIMCSLGDENRFYAFDDFVVECRPGGYAWFYSPDVFAERLKLEQTSVGPHFEVLFSIDDDPILRTENYIFSGDGPRYDALPIVPNKAEVRSR